MKIASIVAFIAQPNRVQATGPYSLTCTKNMKRVETIMIRADESFG
jgi:hypothetical protein